MSIDLSLDRIEALVARFEKYTRPTVHIAGTNGKGSVSALLTSIFQHAGLSVGRFNSPHLLHPSDSISLDGEPVSEELFLSAMQEFREKDEECAINASTFEVLTVCALLVFEREKVDVVILEVGMGGRLDATNVIPDECILVSVITSIDRDHQAFLGPTVDAIAREKAGIIREGKTVVLASQANGIVYDVVGEVSKEKNALLIQAPLAKEREWDEKIDGERPPLFSLRPFAPPPPRPVEVETASERRDNSDRDDRVDLEPGAKSKYRVLLPLHGPHQLGNLGAALTVLHVLRSKAVLISTSTPPGHGIVYERVSQMDEGVIHASVRQCSWPGRLSFHLYRDPSPLSTSSTHLAEITTGGTQSGEVSNRNPLVVLVDGAHNEAAARMLAAYVSSLLASLGGSDSSHGEGRKKKRIRLTIILSLSHSPPKTPASVLVPLLAPFLKPIQEASSVSAGSGSALPQFHDGIELKTRVAFVRFSPPEDMPWVQPVRLSTMRDVVRGWFPYVSKGQVWIAPDTGVQEGEEEEEAMQQLRDALHWASHETGSDEDQAGVDEENLAVVAGSLYLAADFYRLLRLQDQVPQSIDSDQV